MESVACSLDITPSANSASWLERVEHNHSLSAWVDLRHLWLLLVLLEQLPRIAFDRRWHALLRLAERRQELGA